MGGDQATNTSQMDLGIRNPSAGQSASLESKFPWNWLRAFTWT